jgi:hypothetical protein
MTSKIKMAVKIPELFLKSNFHSMLELIVLVLYFMRLHPLKKDKTLKIILNSIWCQNPRWLPKIVFGIASSKIRFFKMLFCILFLCYLDFRFHFEFLNKLAKRREWKKRFEKDVFLKTLFRKQFLATILNSGTILN